MMRLRPSLWREPVVRGALVYACTATLASLSLASAEAQGIGSTPLSVVPRPIVLDPAAQGGGSRQGLGLRVAVFEGWNRNNLNQFVFVPTPPPTSPTSPTSPITPPTTGASPPYHQSGWRSGADAALTYDFQHQGERASLGVNARAGVNVYTSSSRPLYNVRGNFGGSRPLGTRTSVSGTATFSYSPYYNYGLFPALGVGVGAGSSVTTDPDIDFAVASTQVMRYGATLGLRRGLTRRTSLGVNYSSRYTDFGGDYASLLDQNGNIRINHQLNQGVGLHIGYGYHEGRYSVAGPARVFHSIDAGVDYQKAFSLTGRGTTFTFSTGSSFNVRETDNTTARRGTINFRLTGNALLLHQFGRSWSARVSYRRGWDFVDAFTEPFFNDTVTAGFGGQLNQRTTLGASASYLRGSLDSLVSGGAHTTYAARGGVQVQLWRSLAGYAHYIYYQYRFPYGTLLPVDFPSGLERQGVRMGVSMWIPLI